MTLVHVIYRKYDGSLHWHQDLARLGEDEHGIWLAAPAGSTAQRGDEPPVTFAEACVLLIPAGNDARWTMNCNAEPCWTELYLDITTPVRWTAPDTVEMIDMDLDVIRRFDGSAEILDEDEFAEHQVKYGYPPSEIAAAERTAAGLLRAVQRHEEPFADVCRAWLARTS
ncbi:MAG TPA: DUF402 domain-containing protein [Streptosporangiaceae bacterium]